MISPINITVNFTSAVSITCSAQGGPNNRFEWRQRGEVEVITNNPVLEFPMITGSDGAMYECTVFNDAGMETRNVTVTGTVVCLLLYD